MRLDKLITSRNDEPSIVWNETKCYSIDEQKHPENYSEKIVSNYRIGKVQFIEKQLVKK